jgi:hypothetical protein
MTRCKPGYHFVTSGLNTNVIAHIKKPGAVNSTWPGSSKDVSMTRKQLARISLRPLRLCACALKQIFTLPAEIRCLGTG